MQLLAVQQRRALPADVAKLSRHHCPFTIRISNSIRSAMSTPVAGSVTCRWKTRCAGCAIRVRPEDHLPRPRRRARQRMHIHHQRIVHPIERDRIAQLSRNHRGCPSTFTGCPPSDAVWSNRQTSCAPAAHAHTPPSVSASHTARNLREDEIPQSRPQAAATALVCRARSTPSSVAHSIRAASSPARSAASRSSGCAANSAVSASRQTCA
jgi:hypothetical protein